MSDSYNAVGRVYYSDCNVSGETVVSRSLPSVLTVRGELRRLTS